MWDAGGNYCRATLYPYGQGTFELYLHDYNDAIPRRVVGPIGIVNSHADAFLARKKAEGFVEQLPSFNPQAWIA